MTFSGEIGFGWHEKGGGLAPYSVNEAECSFRRKWFELHGGDIVWYIIK